ncbi:Uncharacterised protein [Mycobacteroides abscessus subsp. abscessus]|nr:Uncharacterised protein [Mycobacteroides abscessus subsp. abscessus]
MTNNSADVSTIDLAPSLQPAVPIGDAHDAASAALNDVLDCTGSLQEELRTIASRHFDSAPTSSEHVLSLTAALARTVLDWIERWPS